MTDTNWTIYLSGEIHSNWRKEISNGIDKHKLPIETLSPITNHSDSDDCGTHILGNEQDNFWRDHKSAKINLIRNKTLIESADIVIVRFGEKYRQWNAAFDAGYAAASGIPLITLHDSELNHPLKEIDSMALSVAETPEQIVNILLYVVSGKLMPIKN